MASSYYLELSTNPLKFEPLRKMTDVFYDDKLDEIFIVVPSENVTLVSVDDVSHKWKNSYKINDNRKIMSVKFSPNQRILAVQRTASSVDFITFKNGEQDAEFSRCCKCADAKVLGFLWISDVQFLYVTDLGLELYQVEEEKRELKFIKQLTVSTRITRAHHYSKKDFVLLSVGTSTVYFQPVFVHDACYKKLTKFEVYEDDYRGEQAVKPILERDITVTYFYGHIRILMFHYNQDDSNCPGTCLAVYTVRGATVEKTHLLNLSKRGQFAVNIVDDLVVVHHQMSKTSSIFDIGLPGVQCSAYSRHSPLVHNGLITPVPNDAVELYSKHWITFQPDIIIDVGLGYFWLLLLNLECFVNNLPDRCALIDFLLLRAAGKEHILRVLSGMAQNGWKDIGNIGAIFNRLNVSYRNNLIKSKYYCRNVNPPVFLQYVPNASMQSKVIIDQSDMCRHILSSIINNACDNRDNNDNQYVVAVLLEYLRSLTDTNIVAEHKLCELMIRTLVVTESYQQLHQLLQCRAITDTKPLACLLLSLGNMYPPCYQLALDMMHRIGKATEEITEILLSKCQVVTALRYHFENGNDMNVPFRKYLDTAIASDDPRVFYSVFREFEKRELVAGCNIWNLGSDNLYGVYIAEFRRRFPEYQPLQDGKKGADS